MIYKNAKFIWRKISLINFQELQLIYGKDAMDILSKAHIAIFGIGGVGGYVCEALVRSGVKHFTLIDDDKICLTNCNQTNYCYD